MPDPVQQPVVTDQFPAPGPLGGGPGAASERLSLLGPHWPILPLRAAANIAPERRLRGYAKRLRDLDATFDACEIRNGATLSFHHHYRNGDRVLNAVVACAAKRGLRDLTIAASSIFPVHAALLPHIASGVVLRLITDYMRGPVADAVAAGAFTSPVILQSHGGRARAIVQGELPIDVAFIGAPVCDSHGAATGRGGSVPCGPLGYAMVDAAHAARTVVLADEIVVQPLRDPEIPGRHTDHYLHFPSPGDPAGIQSGATVPADTALARTIVQATVRVVRAAGLLRDGFSFQTGAGGYSLAAVEAIGDAMAQDGIKGSFLSGGITGPHVDIVARGLVDRIRDVQSFDLEAVRSSMGHSWHEAMSADDYANPFNVAPAVNDLSLMLLGAAETDLEFNVNVAVGGDGRIIGGPGGHPDAAEGSSLAIVTTSLCGGGFAKLVDRVACVVTPGHTIDAVVTEAGIAVNPGRPDLADRLRQAGVEILEMDELVALAGKAATRARTVNRGRPCAVVEARRGTPLDAILCR